MGKLSYLTGLSPFGPIFGKELRTTARRRRTYLLRFVYLAALFLVLLGVYTSTSFKEHSGSVAERAQHEADLGGYFFSAFSMFSIFALMAISPVLTATAVSSERMSKTLPVLLMTPITSWQIISGKLFSRMLAALTLIGLSLPVLSVVRLLGGVGVEEMLSVIAVCIAASLCAAAVGLFFSTLMNRAYGVILLSYASMLFLYVFFPFFTTISLASSRSLSSFPYRALLALNPFTNVLMISSPMSRFARAEVIPCIIVQLAMTVALVAWAAAVLRRQARRQGESGGAAQGDYGSMMLPPLPGSLEALSPARPMEPSDSLVQTGRRKKTIFKESSVSDNPVLWREIRRPLMARRWQSVVGSFACIGLLLITYAVIGNAGFSSRNPLSEPDLQIGYAMTFCVLLTLLVCVLSATMIAGEKESDTWTVLLATPLTARAIVLGKVLGVMRRMMWPSVFVVVHFLIFTVCGVIRVTTFWLICWILFVFNSVWIASGVYISLRTKKVTFAVILNLLLPIGAYALVPLFLLIFSNVFLNSNSDRLSQAVLLYAPYYYLGEGISTGGSSSGGSLTSYSMPMRIDAKTEQEFLLIIFVVGVGYLALCAAIIWRTIKRFDQFVGRARQI
jgi:ABC-type transport system involved in multi-copper enzyme maturation permease subunit